MTFDFHRLAADVSGALEFLRTVDEIDAGRIGLCGYSQGGWVAPLAAGLNPAVRFVVVSYGMVDSPAEEARLEMRARMRERGVDDAGIEEADGLIRAAVDIVASDFSDGWDTFHTEKARYRDREWMKTLHGTPVGAQPVAPRGEGP